MDSDSLNLEMKELKQALEVSRKEMATRVKHYEGKLMTMSVINGALQSENERLKEALDSGGSGGQSAMEQVLQKEIQELQEEFTTRLGTAQKQVSAMKEECIELRGEVEQLKQRNNSMATQIKEKDSAIAQYTAEGENMAKKLGELESAVKKYRAEVAKSDQEKEKLQARVQVLEAAAKSTEATRSAALEDANQTISSLRQALSEQKEHFGQLLEEASRQREEDLHRLEKESNELTTKSKEETSRREKMLTASLEAMRQSLAAANQEASIREDELRSEVLALEGKLRSAELAQEEATSLLTEATRPLLRQIDSLNARLAQEGDSVIQRVEWLECQLAAAEELAASAEEGRKRAEAGQVAAERRADAADASADMARSEVAGLRRVMEVEEASKKSLRKECELALERAAVAESQHRNVLLELQAACSQRETAERSLQSLRAEMEAIVEGQEKKKESNASSVLEDVPAGRGSRREESVASQLVAEDGKEVSERFGILRHFRGLEIGSMSGNAFTNERIAAKVKQQAGEIVQLQKELALARASANHATEELLKVSEKVLAQGKRESKVAELEKQLQSLQARHDTALVIIGERNERADELEADLADVKALYREQMNLLINEIDPEKWPQGYRICLFCSHCSQVQRGKKRG